ncbi:tetratricopeptide repeat protein [Myxococcota bacterium]
MDRLIATHQFKDALELVNKMAEGKQLQPDKAVTYRTEIKTAQKTTAMNLRREAQDHHAAKRYDDCVDAGRRAEVFEPLDAATVFVLADALRLSGDLTGAVRYFEKLGKEFPDHPHLDAAFYWRAEHLALTGKRDEARALLKKVGYELKKGSYQRLARRRLRELNR